MLQFIVCAVHIAVLVDPPSNSIQHEFNRWIMVFADITVGHAALHQEDENNPLLAQAA
jgi:hypothetical protein